MMLSTYQRLCLLWMSLAPLSSCESYGYYRVNGQTRLLGSSFGVLGINSIFDYVVRRAQCRRRHLLFILHHLMSC